MSGFDAVRALSVFGGLSAIVVVVLNVTAATWDKSHDWLTYEALGAAVASLPLLRVVDRWLRGRASLVLGVIGLASFSFFIWWNFHQVAVVGALTFLAAVFSMPRPDRLWLVEPIAALAFWTAAIALLSVPSGTFEALAVRPPTFGPFHRLFLPTLMLASWLVAENLFGRRRTRNREWADLLALAPFALSACRADSLLDGMAVHHWSAYLSSALAVRQGGWLLWDTPSQYGFLSTLSIASVPATDVWQSFFLVNVALLTISGYVLFLVFRSWRGRLNYLFALAAALAFTVWVPGWGGPLVTPSAGPARFIWCQLLLFVVWLYYRAPSKRLLRVGTALWIAGCLWSAESMFYCSLTWLPPYVYLAWRREARLRVPVVAVTSVLAIVWIYYEIRLQHPPDLQAFVEYVLAFRHFYTSSISPRGSVWLLFVVLGLSGTALFFDFSHLTLAAAGASWAVVSYFIGNCNEVSATNLCGGILCMVVAILGSVALEGAGRPWSVLVRLGVGTVVVVVLTMDVLANRWLNANALKVGSYDVNVVSRRPHMSDGLVSALRSAGVQSGDPVVFFLLEDPGTGFDWTPWLPFGSLVSLMPISETRQEEYFSRYLARHPSPRGWLVESLSGATSPRFHRFLEKTYRVSSVATFAEWRVTKYERGPSAVGPDPPGSG